MLRKAIEYLKDPQLVADIQKFFGVDVRDLKILEDPLEFDGENNKEPKINGIKPELNGKRNQHAIFNEDSLESINENEIKAKSVPVNNYFWYYLFLFGTELGGETFYCTFIPFWFWNVDGAVGRRIILVWAIVMTFGQTMKDIICWPRPTCPPAVRLQSKWSQEYGMPSTHAMVGVSIPFSVVFFTMNRYIYSIPAGVVIAILWCSLICLSRLYLGMHTVLDILVGLSLAVVMMIPLVPLVNFTNHYLITNEWAFFGLFVISIVTIIYYPKSQRWTPTRGDTAMVVSVTAGAHLGALINYKTGAMQPPLSPPPYTIIWPSWSMLGCGILRTIIGFCCVIATKAISKSLSYTTICAILRVNYKELMKSEDSHENKNKIFVDLLYKYFSCFMIGLNTVYLLPNVFTMIGIERPTFYTEM